MLKPTFLILGGDGINCENETALALKHAGIDSKILTISELIKNKSLLKEAQGLVIPGGFSFADHLGSGHVMANKIKVFLQDEIKEFTLRKRPILGICNGFQMLTKLELFNHSSLRLAHNEKGKFIDTWSELVVNPHNGSPWLSLWQNKIDLKLPIRHGEGRIVVDSSVTKINLEKQIALTYKQNLNGSLFDIAAITDESGLILGMMPHPEAAAFLATDLKNLNQGITPAIGLDLFFSINHFLKNS